MTGTKPLQVQVLTDTLNRLLTEVTDIKKCQITAKELKPLQIALEANAKKIAGVRNAAFKGGQEGVSGPAHSLEQTTRKIQKKVDDAVHGLSEARRVAAGTVRNVHLLITFSTLTGLAMGALASLLVFDYSLGRNFRDSVQLMGLDSACTQQGGLIAVQENGRFYVFQIGE
ncbi:hypothetical protein [Iodidimonas nitroreducens]|uniref:hypothetical protein n=1 Tax=Iodidimonas nitroreducens TaxID=1236968 RepID=UPI001230D4C7|nr:hypothetical protein [Iodidimonas nitroreducens]